MQADDCGPCANLNLRMALEAGVPRELLRALLETPELLPAPLRAIRQHVRACLRGETPDPAAARTIREHYGDAGFAELGVVVVGCRIYPTLKRLLLRAGRCEILSLPSL